MARDVRAATHLECTVLPRDVTLLVQEIETQHAVETSPTPCITRSWVSRVVCRVDKESVLASSTSSTCDCSRRGTLVRHSNDESWLHPRVGLKVIHTLYPWTTVSTIFVSNLENPDGTQVIVGSMNMEYSIIYPTLQPGIELTTCSVPNARQFH